MIIEYDDKYSKYFLNFIFRNTFFLVNMINITLENAI